MENSLTLNMISECNYLNYVVKEGLRIDSPGHESLNHYTYEVVVICGVPIPKNNTVKVDILVTHMLDTEWVRPTEFIPERFDPESEHFSKTDSGGKSRSPYTWVPFSYGMRG